MVPRARSRGWPGILLGTFFSRAGNALAPPPQVAPALPTQGNDAETIPGAHAQAGVWLHAIIDSAAGVERS